METSREDVSIAIRSSFLKKGAQQKFSLFALTITSIILIFLETIESKPLNYARSILKDFIYRGSIIIASPNKGAGFIVDSIQEHFDVFNKYQKLKEENAQLKEQTYDPNFLKFENEQLKKLLDEQMESPINLVGARVMLDKQSPYLNSFIINSGSNKEIKKGMAVLDGKNFIGRIVDVNFFSSRILLITDLNSKIPVLIEPEGYHAILSGDGSEQPVLEFLPENNTVETGNKVYTSGKEGIFSPGIPIGKVIEEDNNLVVSLFSDFSQITFVNVVTESIDTEDQ